MKDPKRGSKRMDEFCPQKGVEHALDYRCDSLNSVAVGISRWLYGWRTHSYPAGHCRHRVSGPTYSGAKNIVAIWTLAGERDVFGKEVVSGFRKTVEICSVEKVLELTISPQAYREE
jgi:hypothetical protein